ncbi:hypothetical protein KKE06_03550 [Candidatus Micrarchaeota archaeon]|nr:hypothetical protein [Candidatus Micrarchaeota archaeon]MBU1930872.1 hypothetical protein [Candidatus Micrarchaeota archaeon]
MVEQEPIDEMHALWQRLVKGLRILFQDHTHRDLKRSYGSECALVLLKEVPHQDLYLRLENGITLKSLCDLAEVLPALDEETFEKHTNKEKNNFSDWVRNVIGDKTLANKLDFLESQEDTARAVNVRVNWFKRRIS